MGGWVLGVGGWGLMLVMVLVFVLVFGAWCVVFGVQSEIKFIRYRSVSSRICWSEISLKNEILGLN